MKQERRSSWYEWTCDLDGCRETDTTHPVLDENGKDQVPEGWLVVHPPRFWRGSSLAFCSTAHRNQWAQDTVGPLLLGPGG